MELTPEELVKKLKESVDHEPFMLEPAVMSPHHVALNLDDLYGLIFQANSLGLRKTKVRTVRVSRDGKVIFKVHPNEPDSQGSVS
jgi:hypothetical protein